MQAQAQGARGQIGKSFVGQQKKTTVINDERQAAATLFFGPANPPITSPQAARGGAKDQHAQPLALSDDSVPNLFPDSADITQVVMFGQQAPGVGSFLASA